LRRHTKPILLADISGFWRPLLALMAHMRLEDFIRDGFDAHYLVAEKIADVPEMLQNAWAKSASA
jgi:predicted Rossmann-fold nucleotide-binding protein